MQRKKLILFELNEVPFRIIDHFTKLKPNSAIARLRRRSRAYETFTEDSGHLSPWVTWPTLHRGVTNLDHNISHFGQDLGPVNREFPALWQILTNNGVRCGVFGSLQSYPLPKNLDNYAFYVPDTFAAGPECFPKSLEVFQKFNLTMVDRSARDVTSGIALKEGATFLGSAPGLGLRPRTVAKLAKQLLDERVNPSRVVRRRTSQVQIAFDFFLRSLKTERPDMAFFFTNHVASSMHRYWPALFPEDYEHLRYDEQWLKKWSEEIPFAFSEAAAQIEDVVSFVDQNRDYILLVASSMGQAAIQNRERIDSTLTLSDHAAFAATLGLRPNEWSKQRAMAPEFVFQMSPETLERFVLAVGQLTINGRTPRLERLGDDRICIVIGIDNLKNDEIEIVFKGERISPSAMGLHNLSLQDAAGANAYHVPNGICLVYEAGSPEQRDMTPKPLSSTEIAPSILANFGIDRPSYMQAPLSL